MPTDDQLLATRRGAGVAQARPVSKLLLDLVVAGNTTVAGTIVVPAGSWVDAVQIETPTAISGTPTSCLVRAGTALHGQQIVADVDAKAQGHIGATIVAAFDKIGAAASADTTLFFEVTTAGGTASAGTIHIAVAFVPPVF